VWDEIAPRVAQAYNARGIGYRRKGRVVGTFPEESHPKILYRVALLARAQPEARDFLQFLVSPEAAPAGQGVAARFRPRADLRIRDLSVTP